jgi:hypothetical protein
MSVHFFSDKPVLSTSQASRRDFCQLSSIVDGENRRRIVLTSPNVNSLNSEPSTSSSPFDITAVLPNTFQCASPFVLSPVSSVEERWIRSLECIARNDSDGLLLTLLVLWHDVRSIYFSLLPTCCSHISTIIDSQFQRWPLLALRRDNSFGFTLLHYAAFSDSAACARTLLQVALQNVEHTSYKFPQKNHGQ